jgi:hypothetical protein
MDASSLATRLFNRTNLFISLIEKSSTMYLSVKDNSVKTIAIGEKIRQKRKAGSGNRTRIISLEGYGL